jgi:putative hydrolase of the HAD superfamily
MKTFLFDIGNVLANFDFQRLLEIYSEHSGRPIAPQSERDEEMYDRVEKGLLNESDYVDYLNESKGMQWEVRHLAETWQQIFTLNETGRGLLEKAIDSDAQVYTLSNIARYHVVALEANWNTFFDGFTGLFMSYEMGVRKPDPRIYEMVLDELGVDGGDCFFIDDLPQNIEAARVVGIQAHHFVPETHAAVQRAAAEFFGWELPLGAEHGAL